MSGGCTVRTKPIWAETLVQSELFADVVEVSHSYRLSLPAQVVIGVECTRATFLSFDESERVAFVADLRAFLGSAPEIDVRQETFLAMARVQERQ